MLMIKISEAQVRLCIVVFDKGISLIWVVYRVRFISKMGEACILQIKNDDTLYIHMSSRYWYHIYCFATNSMYGKVNKANRILTI